MPSGLSGTPEAEPFVFYRREYSRMVAIARALLQSGASAEDLAQESFQEELDQYAEFGSYALWRIGITEDGEWKFFVAGD